MSAMSVMNILMNKQLTCLPSLLDKYISKYYNNALGNTLFWLFIIWFSIHLVFDKFMNAFLRRMKYSEYMRLRILSTLWGLGFSFMGCVYCYATLSRNYIDILEKNHLLQEKDVPGQYILGFTVICSYYVQAFCWEVNNNGLTSCMLDSMLMACYAVLAYYVGCVEYLFSLVFLTGLSQFVLEISRAFTFHSPYKPIRKMSLYISFVFHLILSFLMYWLIPFQFLIPSIKGFMYNHTFLLGLLNIFLWSWFFVHVYNSALYKVIQHYLWHAIEDANDCELSLLECSMFPCRNDTAFNVFLIRKQIDADKMKMTTRRKKPNEAALFQTVKCMLAIKKKIKQRRDLRSIVANDSAHEICSGILHEMLDEVCQQDGATSHTETT